MLAVCHRVFVDRGPVGCLRQNGRELPAACSRQCVQRTLRPAGGAGCARARHSQACAGRSLRPWSLSARTAGTGSRGHRLRCGSGNDRPGQAQGSGTGTVDQAALGESLPYPDGAFDLVVCALAIHYASDRGAAFAEFCRVLRPGGAAVVSTRHPVMDWLRKGGSYFQPTLETDIWHTPSGISRCDSGANRCRRCVRPQPVPDSSMRKVIEPVPAESMREHYPED